MKIFLIPWNVTDILKRNEIKLVLYNLLTRIETNQSTFRIMKTRISIVSSLNLLLNSTFPLFLVVGGVVDVSSLGRPQFVCCVIHLLKLQINDIPVFSFFHYNFIFWESFVIITHPRRRTRKSTLTHTLVHTESSWRSISFSKNRL